MDYTRPQHPQQYRREAERVRANASTMHHVETRLQLLEIAWQYEMLAKCFEGHQRSIEARPEVEC